jgi:hypothetical protein
MAAIAADDVVSLWDVASNSEVGVLQHGGKVKHLAANPSTLNPYSQNDCGIDCEDTGEVPSRPGLTQELTGFVPCQRFVGWGGLGASLNHRMTS